jgi:hypothetical protein
MSDDPRVEAASAIGYAQMRHDPAVWHEALDNALPDMLAAADAVDPLRASATVCVRLDGLADRIAATMFADSDGDWLPDDCTGIPVGEFRRLLDEALPSLLQSLAVQ